MIKRLSQDRHLLEGLTVAHQVAVACQRGQPELPAIAAQRIGDGIHVTLVGEHQPRSVDAPVGARRRSVRVHVASPDPGGAHPVDRSEDEHGNRRQCRAIVGVRAAVGHDLHIGRQNRAVTPHGRAHSGNRIGPARRRQPFFERSVLHAHRASVALRQQCGEGFEAHVELGPETAADVVSHHPHRGRCDTQDLGHPVPQAEWVLVGDLDGVPARLVGGERHLGFQMRLVLPGRAIGAFHHEFRCRKRFVEVARVVHDFCDHVAVAPDVGPACDSEAVPLRMHQARTRCQCLLRRGHGLDWLDVDGNRSSSGFGCRSALCNHDRDRFALIGHIVGGQHGSVRHDHTGSPIRHVGSSHHLQHPVNAKRGNRIDRPKVTCGHRRPRERRPQHPGLRQVGAEDRLSAQLRIGIAAFRAGAQRAHDATARAASTAASTICW